MTLSEIKQAIAEGKTVHWSNGLYYVKKVGEDKYVIACESNNHAIGLTWQDGVTMNGKEESFYIAETVKQPV